MAEWQLIETAPKNGTHIQTKIPGHGSDNIIAWECGFVNENDEDSCTWVWMSGNEPPSCWTNGVCWDANENEQPSVRPTHWKHQRDV